ASGNVYVADILNQSIQKFTNTGTLLLAWGSVGSGNGQFVVPDGIAVDGSGNVYVVDTFNYRIQKFTNTGTFLTKWGTEALTLDGQFKGAEAVAVDGSGNVYVADRSNERIQKFTSSGTFLTKWGAYDPVAVSIDANGNVDVGSYRNSIQKFTNTGAFVTEWGGYGTADGQFTHPSSIAVDGNGTLFVADHEEICDFVCFLFARIQKFTSTGTFLGTWGSYGSATGQLSGPPGVAV